MKKFFFLAGLAAGTQAAQAQSIAAGTVSLGGSIGYSSISDNSEYKSGSTTYTADYTGQQLQFSPAAGYFVADNLAIGLNLSFTSTKNNVTFSGPGGSPPVPEASTTLRVGPYVQYYKMVSEQFGILGTFGVGYQRSFRPSNANSSSTNPQQRIIETTTSGFYTSITPGVIFFPIPRFGLSASVGNLGYERFKVKHSDDVAGESETGSLFGAKFGFSELLLGGTYFFGR